MLIRFFRSIWFRIVSLVFIAAIPALLIIITNVTALRANAVASAHDSARAALDVVAAYQDRLIDGGKQFLRTLSVTPQVRSGNAAECSAFLADLLVEAPHYLNIGVVDREGFIHCSALPIDDPVDARERLWYRETVRTGAFSIGEYQVGRITKRQSVNFGYPLFAVDGSLEGVVFVALDPHAFNTIARAITVSPGDSFTVFDRNGIIIYRHPNPDAWIGKAVPDAEIVEAIAGAQTEGTVTVSGLDAVRRLYAYRPLTLSPESGIIYVAFGIPEASALREAENILAGNLTAFVVVTVFMLVWAWFVAYLVIVRRTRFLAEATERVARGDLSVRVSRMGGPTEFRSLAASFDQMAERLAQRTERLEHETAKTRAILSAVGEGVIAIDRKKRVIAANAAAGALLGYETDELIGADVAARLIITDAEGKSVPAKDLPLTLALMGGKRVVVNPIKNSHTYYFNRRDGSRFPISLIANPVELDGTREAAVIAFRDITDELNIDRAKTEFVSLASHQLRTPLSIISWYTEAVLGGKAGRVDAKAKQYLEEAHAASARMTELVNALLNVSRLSAGVLDIRPEPTDLAALVRSVISDYAVEAKRKRIAVTERYDPKLARLRLDPKLIRIIIQNLVSNAIKFTPKGGAVKVGLERRDGGALLTVADDGYGIPPEQQDKVFTKLFRADNVRELAIEGTGLGLYIVKEIVDLTGGEVWFTSKLNQGTTFSALIPESGMRRTEGSRELVPPRRTDRETRS